MIEGDPICNSPITNHTISGIIFMPDNCTKWALWNTVHAPPAPAHIQERAFIPVKTAEGIPAACFARQANIANLAQIIIYLQHVPS